MKQGWEYKKLGEVCTKGSSNISLNKIEENNGEYALFGASGYVKGIDFYHQDQSYIGVVKDGSGVGRVDIYPEKSSLVGTMQYIFPKAGCELGYLKYLLQGLHLEKYKTGAAIPHIYFRDYENCKVRVPKKEEQQKIVSELDLLSGVIEKQKAQLAELDKLAQSIFYETFGDPVANEKGWEYISLGNVVEISSKLVDPNEDPYSNQYHVSPANIISGTGEIIDCRLAKDECLISGKYAFKKGAVLYSKIRPNLNKVAIPNFDGICSADMYPLTVKDRAINLYIQKLLSSKEFLKYAINCSGRARMPKINREALFQFNFCCPPLSLQQEFAAKVEAIEAMKAKVRQSLKEAETLFASRMDYYFN